MQSHQERSMKRIELEFKVIQFDTEGPKKKSVIKIPDLIRLIRNGETFR